MINNVGTIMEAPWLIAAAVDMEIRGLRNELRHVQRRKVPRGKAWSGLWGNNSFWMVRTGVGPENARKTVEPLLASEKFRGILSVGYAGGLKDGYRVGDLVIPEEIVFLPPLGKGTFYPTPFFFQEACTVARKGRGTLHTGRMITSSRVICSSTEKNRLGTANQAGAVEMESAVLAGLARNAGIDFLVVRVISDEVSFSMPDNLKVFQYWRRKQFLKMVRSVVSKPSHMVQLFRLGLHTMKASKRLNSLMVEGLLEVLGAEA